MAGQARRVPRAPGRSRAAPSWPTTEAAAVAGSSAVPATSAESGPPSRPLPSSGSALATRSTYRALLIRGLNPTEAADLTSWLAGIPAGSAHWKLAELNRLLFLKLLNEGGRFGAADGGSTDPR